MRTMDNKNATDRMLIENRLRSLEIKKALQEQREYLHDRRRTNNAKMSGKGAKECARRVKQMGG